MWAKLKQLFSLEKIENNDDRQAGKALLAVILGSLATFLVTTLSGLYWKEWPITFTGVLGIVLQIIPLLLLLLRQQVQASGFIVGVISLILVTFSATMGQGIHDIAIMAYPVIIIIASLIIHRHGFVSLFLMVIASIGWLVYGEARGLFLRHEILVPSWADFFIMVAVLSVAALAVYVQATSLRNNLRLAQQEIARRKSMEEQLRYLGTHDILTGIYNRLLFEEELARLERGREFPVSVIVADLDNLKNTNDAHGHSTGDELLKRATQAFSSAFREGDVLARIGGDEFAVLLPNTNPDTAREILMRVRDRITQHNIRYPDLPVELSLGTATAQTGDLSLALTEADRQMYADKSTRKSSKGDAANP